jgi:hypothetical protein
MCPIEARSNRRVRRFGNELMPVRRGEIRVLERKGLEAAACRCYPIVSALAG